LNDIKRLELLFFEVLKDLKDYLDDLTLVGGWLALGITVDRCLKVRFRKRKSYTIEKTGCSPIYH